MSTEARQTLDKAMTEKQFQQRVVDLAQLCGWLVFHPYDMRRSREGYPDLTLVHPSRALIVWAELKRESGKLSEYQMEWLVSLGEVAEGINRDADSERVIVRTWRPSDWNEITHLLSGGQAV